MSETSKGEQPSTTSILVTSII